MSSDPNPVAPGSRKGRSPFRPAVLPVHPGTAAKASAMPAPVVGAPVGFVSLGCPKNRVDSEIMLGHLAGRGHSIVDPDEAAVVVVNTCGFIAQAKEESVDAILEQVDRKRRGEIERVVVAGCMVQKYGAELAREIPEIDAFVGLDELELAPAAVVGSAGVAVGTNGPVKPLATRLYDESSPRLLSTTGGHAYLKIAEGCDNPCTFCTIPQMRGSFRSRTIPSLVAEATRLEAQGVHELVLIAQDTTRYGEDLGFGRSGLARLVEALLAATGFHWIRFLYAYPKTLDESVLRLMGGERRFVSYLDMPLQSVSRPVLARMRRGGDLDGYLRTFARIRELVPDVALRTTFIVGFPGETEREVEESIRFLHGAELDHVGVFEYSPEPGSASEPLGDPVPEEEKRERRERLLAIQQEISRRRNRERIGTIEDALIEGPCDETDLLLEGRIAGQAPGIDGRLLVNDVEEGIVPRLPGFHRVEITEAHEYDLVGRLLVDPS